MPRERPITFRSAGEQVVGMLHLPEGKGPFPAVVFFHGFTGNKSEAHRLFVQTARGLAGAGVAALRIDFRGSGDSAGEFSQMSVSSEVADGHAALRYLRGRRDIDRQRIGILGMSMGGMVASLVTADEPEVRAVVLWNPVADAKGLRDRRYSEELRRQFDALGVVDWGGWAVGPKLLEEWGTVDPLAAAARVTAPVLVVCGTRDETVPPIESENYRAVMERAGRTVALYAVEGADHCFNTLAWTAEAMAATLAWFGCHLSGRKP
jgi:dienelactone hydrolase